MNNDRVPANNHSLIHSDDHHVSLRVDVVASSKFEFFDDAAFSPPEELHREYYEAVGNGFARMKERRVVFAGLARNIADILPMTIARIEATAQCFADYAVCVYENDSSDITPDLLRSWSDGNHRVTIRSESLGDPVNFPIRCSQRADRMAAYRRRCQEVILANWSDFDDVILIDLDVQGGWSLEGLATTFASENWDFVGSNGIIFRRIGLLPNECVQYDAWAFRLDDAMTPISSRDVNQMRFQRGAPFVPVRSCFGGLGVYRMDAFRLGNYVGGDTEHVGFHRSLIQQGCDRLFLNPSQIVVYGRKHRRLDSFAERLLRTATSFGLATTDPWKFARTFESPRRRKS